MIKQNSEKKIVAGVENTNNESLEDSLSSPPLSRQNSKKKSLSYSFLFKKNSSSSINVVDNDDDIEKNIDQDSIKQRNKKKAKKKFVKITMNNETKYFIPPPKDKLSIFTYNGLIFHFKFMLNSPNARKVGAFFYSFGFILLLILDLLSTGPWAGWAEPSNNLGSRNEDNKFIESNILNKIVKYNYIIIITLAASIEFKYFPTSTVYPQIFLCLLYGVSLAFDAFFWSKIYLMSYRDTSDITEQNNIDATSILIINHSLGSAVLSLFTVFILCKTIVLIRFLKLSNNNNFTRKYLSRRLRILFPPLRVPRRIMRDIRARLLVAFTMEFISSIAFFILIIVYFFNLSYASFHLGNFEMFGVHSGGDRPLIVYMFLQLFTSMALFIYLLLDVDLVLYFSYFGCCFTSSGHDFVKNYIAKKRVKLGGWPLVFAFSSPRLYITISMKIFNIFVGIFGGIIIISNFTKFKSFDDSLRSFFYFITFFTFLSLIWSSIVFYSVHWLWKQYNFYHDLNILDDSDDSEIEELDLRTDINPLIKQYMRRKERKQMMVKKYLELDSEEDSEGEYSAEDEDVRPPALAKKWLFNNSSSKLLPDE